MSLAIFEAKFARGALICFVAIGGPTFWNGPERLAGRSVYSRISVAGELAAHTAYPDDARCSASAIARIIVFASPGDLCPAGLLDTCVSQRDETMARVLTCAAALVALAPDSTLSQFPSTGVAIFPRPTRIVQGWPEL